jgi:putative tryptophan/tyrosine transport system substrate-binding protein
VKRREFIAGVGGAVAWQRIAGAQQPALPVIGFLSAGSLDAWRGRIAAFQRGLGDIGYIEGRNVAIEYRWAEGEYDRLPALALELVRRPVAVIFANSTPGVLAAKSATPTIPIVFLIGVDPVKLGLVASFNRPGANATGFSVLTNALGPKKLELLHELVPQVSVVAMLVNPANQNAGPDATDATMRLR